MARPKLGRAIAALTGVSVAMLVAALPASAEDPVTATSLDKHEQGLDITVLFEGAKEPGKLPTRLSDIQIKDGPTVKTYEFIPGAELKKPDLVEIPFFDGGGDDAAKTLKLAKLADEDDFQKKINWALRHSYPFVGVDALSSKLSIEGLTNKEAIAGTQAAIWQLLFGGFELTDANNEHVLALYKYLIGEKNTGAVNDKAPTLDITPATVTGTEAKIGPVTVKTSAKELTLTLPDGVKVVDKDGKEIAAKDIKDGSELFFQVPTTASGQGTVELKATGGEASRAFLGGQLPEQVPARELKVASDEVPDFQVFAFAQNLSTTVKINLSWTAAETPPAPQGDSGGLANTGVSIYVPLSIAVLLLLAGGGALLYLRRRRA